MQETWRLIPESGRSPREGNGYPLQYSYLENSMNTLSVALPVEICRCLETGLSSFDIYCCAYSLTVELEEEPYRL